MRWGGFVVGDIVNCGCRFVYGCCNSIGNVGYMDVIEYLFWFDEMVCVVFLEIFECVLIGIIDFGKMEDLNWDIGFVGEVVLGFFCCNFLY